MKDRRCGEYFAAATTGRNLLPRPFTSDPMTRQSEQSVGVRWDNSTCDQIANQKIHVTPHRLLVVGGQDSRCMNRVAGRRCLHRCSATSPSGSVCSRLYLATGPLSIASQRSRVNSCRIWELFPSIGPARYVKGVSALCEGYESEAGPFHIVEHAEVFHPVFQGHYLGAYPTAQRAADDLAQGRTLKVPRC